MLDILITLIAFFLSIITGIAAWMLSKIFNHEIRIVNIEIKCEEQENQF